MNGKDKITKKQGGSLNYISRPVNTPHCFSSCFAGTVCVY